MTSSSDTLFAIVVNDQMQFDIWPMRRKLAPGWTYVGPTGTRDQMQALLRLQIPTQRRRKAAGSTTRS